jgi:hypothetical protein
VVRPTGGRELVDPILEQLLQTVTGTPPGSPTGLVTDEDQVGQFGRDPCLRMPIA